MFLNGWMDIALCHLFLEFLLTLIERAGAKPRTSGQSKWWKGLHTTRDVSRSQDISTYLNIQLWVSLGGETVSITYPLKILEAFFLVPSSHTCMPWKSQDRWSNDFQTSNYCPALDCRDCRSFWLASRDVARPLGLHSWTTWVISNRRTAAKCLAIAAIAWEVHITSLHMALWLTSRVLMGYISRRDREACSSESKEASTNICKGSEARKGLVAAL